MLIIHTGSRSDNSSSSGTESDRNVSRDRGGGSPVNSGGSSVSSGGFQMNGKWLEWWQR